MLAQDTTSLPHDGLRRALLTFANASAALLASKFPDGPHRREAFEVSDHQVLQVERPDWQSSIYACWDLFFKLDEYSAVLAAIAADPVVDEHVRLGFSTPLAGGSLEPPDWTLALVAYSLSGELVPTVSPGAFDAGFNDLVAFFDSDAIPLVAIAPLHGLELPNSPINPATDITLDRLSPEERNTYWESWGQHASALGFTPLGWERYVARIRVSVPKRLDRSLTHFDIEHPYLTVQKRLGMVLSALRLLHTGHVDHTYLRLQPERWCPFLGAHQHGGLPNDLVAFDGVYVAETDADQLAALLLQVTALASAPDSGLKVALGRLNMSLERTALLDRLVDAIVGLEAIFLADVEGELSYRLSLRAAAATSADRKQRARSYRLVKAAYGLRSKILHGKTPPSDIQLPELSLTPPRLVDNVIELLRLAIIRAMTEHNNDLVGWLAVVDDELLGAAPSPPKPS